MQALPVLVPRFSKDFPNVTSKNNSDGEKWTDECFEHGLAHAHRRMMWRMDSGDLTLLRVRGLTRFY